MSADRIKVLCDLDESIVNVCEASDLELLPDNFQNRFDYKDIVAYGMRVFARPGLQEYLDFLFDNFDVSVFTAAEQEYAMFIVMNFMLCKPGRKIHHIFFRYHNDMALKRYDGMKDLRLLWYVYNVPGFHPCNTVIVDDLIDVYETNPNNTIRVKAFRLVQDGHAMLDAVDDKELPRVQKVLTTLDENFKHSSCPRQLYLGQAPNETSPFLL